MWDLRWYLACAGLGLFSGCLTGCGGGSEEKEKPKPPPAAGPEISFPETLQASDGVHNLHLGPVPFLDFGFDTRGYNGGIPGPFFRVKPGETLKVNLTNGLNAADSKSCAETGTNYCDSEVTNLHTHGLHVSSKGYDDGLTYSSDDIFTMVTPGNSARFDFAIPEHHAPGMHWYHPHHHHSTSFQASGGAAGVIIVDDPTDFLPAEYSNMTEVVLMVSYHDLRVIQKYSRYAQSKLLSNAWDIAQTKGLAKGHYLVNGQVNPTLTIKAGTWYRLRIVFAAIYKHWNFTVSGIEGGPSCKLGELAKDGVYFESIPRDIDQFLMYPGSREDVVFSCTCASFPCRVATGTESDESVMTFTVQQDAASAPVLPEYRPPQPCYLADLRSAVVPAANVGEVTTLDNLRSAVGPAANVGEVFIDRTIKWNGNGNKMTYVAVHENGGTIKDWPPIATFQVGDVYEMHLHGLHKHPMHMHVNPFQIVELPGDSSRHSGFRVGEWHDTILLPLLEETETVKVRFQTDFFTGKQVIHCHKLQHEDDGMMNFFRVAGIEGSEFECAKSLNPTCYNGAFDPTKNINHTVSSSCVASGASSPVKPVIQSHSQTGVATAPRVVQQNRLGGFVVGTALLVAGLGVLTLYLVKRRGGNMVGSGRAAGEDVESADAIKDDENENVELKAARS